MKDGHIHTPYCNHGTKDPLEDYVKKALEVGLTEMSFTEHLPLLHGIPGVTDEFLDESGMYIDNIMDYINDVKILKEKYKNSIKINIGFEVDYFEGYEDKTIALLNKYGAYIDDSILSTHFVKYEDNFYAVDMLEDFSRLLEKVGSLEKVYDLYFNTVLKSINSDLGMYKPKRIGHITLVRRFAEKFPHEYKNIELFSRVIEELKHKDYEIDYNTAGLRKELCGETYPSGIFLEIIDKNNIRKIYGSDSHSARDVGEGFGL